MKNGNRPMKNRNTVRSKKKFSTFSKSVQIFAKVRHPKIPQTPEEW